MEAPVTDVTLPVNRLTGVTTQDPEDDIPAPVTDEDTATDPGEPEDVEAGAAPSVDDPDGDDIPDPEG
jgi:hypothetical protein